MDERFKYPTLIENNPSPNESHSNLTDKDKQHSIVIQQSMNQKKGEILKNKIVKLPEELSIMDPAYKDLLNRLLEINPMHRLKSILGLERIAFYKQFSFDTARKKQLHPIDFIKFAPTVECDTTTNGTLAEF